MIRKQLIVIILALCMLLCCGCGTDYDFDKPEKGERETTAAQTQEETEPDQTTTGQEVSAYPGTDFTVYDMDGNAVKLSDMVGKPVVLNFWATWCDPCKSELPAFQSAYEEYGDQVQFMMVDLIEGRTETVEMATEYAQEQGYTFPLFFDSDQEASAAYELYAIPASYFIDEEGNLVANHVGAMDYDTLVAYIEEII